jgi:hypothetical protein
VCRPLTGTSQRECFIHAIEAPVARYQGGCLRETLLTSSGRIRLPDGRRRCSPRALVPAIRTEDRD